MEPLRSNSVVRFGTYEVSFESGEVRKAGLRIRIQQQPMKLLQILLERPGEVVTREELRSRIWTDEVSVISTKPSISPSGNCAVLLGTRQSIHDSSRLCQNEAIALSRKCRRWVPTPLSKSRDLRLQSCRRPIPGTGSKGPSCRSRPNSGGGRCVGPWSAWRQY
jgi:hypothetical protein